MLEHGAVCALECVLPDSDVRMNVSRENSGGDQVVSGVRSYEREGYLVGSLGLTVTGYHSITALSHCLFQASVLLQRAWREHLWDQAQKPLQE